jgi:TonB family protein
MSSVTHVWKQWEGRQVDGKFRLGEWLGGSDHSAVFRVVEEKNGAAKAAVKFISAQSLTNGNRSEETQLLRWAVTAHMSQPNLIRLFEFGRCDMEDERFLYVVMEYAEEDLSQILPQRALAPEEVKEMLPPVVEALAFLHEQGFVHGRIKPSNVLAVNNQLKISADSLHDIGEPGGETKSVYAAPEAAKALSPASDAWSVGVLLVAALSGHEPDVRKVESGQVVVSADVPQPYREMAQKCLRIDPQRRSRVSEILGGRAKVAASAPQAAVREAVPAPIPVRREEPIFRENESGGESKNRWIGVVAVVLVLLVIAVIGVRMLQHRASAPGESHPAEQSAAPASQAAPAQTATPQTVVPQPVPSQPATPPPTTAPSSGTARGSVAHQVIPEISRQAQKTIHGRIKVNVEVEVDASGNVSHAKLASGGPSRYFADRALEAARGWKFNPARGDGQPSSSTWLLRFQFSRGATQVFPAETNPK